MESELLLWVSAPHFCAGAVYSNGRFVAAAPILKWMVGRKPKYVKEYLQRKGYTYQWIRTAKDKK